MADPLARFIPQANATPSEIRAMSAAAWHQRGFVCLRLEDIRNEIDREVIRRAAERLYGVRDHCRK